MISRKTFCLLVVLFAMSAVWFALMLFKPLVLNRIPGYAGFHQTMQMYLPYLLPVATVWAISAFVFSISKIRKIRKKREELYKQQPWLRP